jgi:hypothetical protein
MSLFDLLQRNSAPTTPTSVFKRRSREQLTVVLRGRDGRESRADIQRPSDYL